MSGLFIGINDSEKYIRSEEFDSCYILKYPTVTRIYCEILLTE